MEEWAARERRWWSASVVLIVLIYATLYFVRGPVEYLRDRGLLRLTVAAVFAAAAVPLLWNLWRRRPGPREVLVLAAAIVGLFYASRMAAQPEEKLHFLEYGLLGGMLFEATRLRALRLGRRGVWGRGVAALVAALLAALAGWGDEGIQSVLPNRVYDVRDIVFNVVASSLVVAALLGASWARTRDLAARGEPESFC